MGIDADGDRLYKKRESRALNPVRRHLTEALVAEGCRLADHQFRKRCWTPLLTVLACVWKQMNSASLRQAEDWVSSLLQDAPGGQRDGSDLCAARKRLPLGVFEFVLRMLGRNTAERLNHRFHDMPVHLVDGTTLRTPDTDENSKALGRSKNQSGHSRLLLVRLVLLVCAGCGVVLDASYGAYAISEWVLFLELLPRIPSGGLFLADSAYSSFLMCSECLRHGSHVLTRLNKLRRASPLRRLGDGDEIHRWTRPYGRHVSRPDLLERGPAELEMRIITRILRRTGYRDVLLSVATTLLDPIEYPADELIDLYLTRWHIELDLRTMKTHYGMALLSGQTGDVIYKEICSIIIAHNCIVAAQVESRATPRTLSHTRARQLLVTCADQMVWVSVECMVRLYKRMLNAIARAKLDATKRLPQPRAIIQRTSTYPVLTTTREEWRRAHHVA